MDKFMTDNKQ